MACIKCRSEEKSGKQGDRRCPNCGYRPSPYECNIEKYGKEEADRLLEITKEKMRNRKPTMKGKTVYQCWLEKYGKEEADRLLSQMKNKQSERRQGENNPFFGKKQDKEKLKKAQANRKKESYQTEDFKNKCKRLGSSNGMFGKTVLECMEAKYGIEEAKKRWTEQNKKKARYGSDNGQFGKPAPMGSGNGWSGWFSGFYFRSLLELSFIVQSIKNGIEIKSAESNDYRIEYYDKNGKKRNYFPDYVINDVIYEIKPYSLLNTGDNKPKFDAAKEKFGPEKFIILTEKEIDKLPDDVIKLMYINGEIKFTERYNKKFKERYL